MNGHKFIFHLYSELAGREPTLGEYVRSASLLASGKHKCKLFAEMLLIEEAARRCKPPDRKFNPDLAYHSSSTGTFPPLIKASAESYGPLAGVVRHTSDWMHRYWTDSTDIAQMYKVFEPESPIYTEPKGVDSAVAERFKHHLFNNPLAEQFVAVVPEGRVFGEHGVVISPDHYILWDLSPDFGNPVSQHFALNQTEFPPVAYTSETLAVLTSSVSYSYYHWLFEVLARIDLLRRSGIEADRFVLNRKGIAFQNETLAALGIPNDKIIDCNEATHLQAKKLVVPSFAAYTGHAPKWACDFLQKELQFHRQPQQLEKFKRIYVSRADAMYRRVVNELEVMAALEDYGFTCVTLGRLSVRQQAEIFSSAQIIVAPHGAGLTNLVFCNPGTKVIEMFTPSFLNPTFWVPCTHMNLDYYYLIGRSAKGLSDGWDGTDDIIVDTDKLIQILKMAGISKVSAIHSNLIGNNGAEDAELFEGLQALLQTDDCEFVTRAYWNILGRDPDRPGLEHYVGLVRNGSDKLGILAQMMQTNEALQLYS